MKENKYTYRKDFYETMKYLKGHRFLYGVGIIGKIIVESSAALLEAYLLKQFLDVGEKDSLGKIGLLCLGILLYVCVIMLVSPLFTYLFNANAKMGHGAVNKSIYRKYGALTVGDLEQNHSGAFLSLFANDTWVVSTIFMRHFRRVVSSLATIMIYLVPMFVLDWRITSIMLSLNILTFLVNGYVAKHMKQRTKEIQGLMENTTVSITNLVCGMSVIRMYQMIKAMQKDFHADNTAVRSVQMKRAKLSSILSAYQYSVYLINIFIFLGLGSLLVSKGITTYGAILSIMSLQASLDFNFKEFGEYYPQFFHGLAATERVSDFEHRAEEPIQYQEKMQDKTKIPSSAIEFSDVSFGYEEGKEVLSHFHMSIEQGEYVALVGESGAGKSSIAKLLLGFYPIQGGTILVNGHDMMQSPLSRIRQQIAYVPQEPAIYTTTIMENIRYGNPNASDEEVMDAARKADAYDFIMEQEHGFATCVGENGVRLSGGQKQRIAIARAFLKDAPILLFDEATSALDNITEQKILKIIESCRKDKTIIMIAHRKTSIEQADRVIVIGNHNKEFSLCGE